VRYAAIEDQSIKYSVRTLCRLLGVSRGGYYAWHNRQPSDRSCYNERLVKAMREIHRTVDSSYGSPRMHSELLSRGFHCSLNRVARLMRANGLIARTTVRFRSLTKLGRRDPAAPNLLNRQFSVSSPNQVWATDITYIPTAEGHLYLAVVMDLYSRLIVGWAMTSRLGTELVSTALRQAVMRRDITPGLIHHSDRDGLYNSIGYKRLLTQYGMISSMSRKGNCYDNACVESFFASLKTEMVAFERFKDRSEAKEKLFIWIETFYNRLRKHSYLHYKSPIEYESDNKHAI